jgi:hypothetical protein
MLGTNRPLFLTIVYLLVCLLVTIACWALTPLLLTGHPLEMLGQNRQDTANVLAIGLMVGGLIVGPLGLIVIGQELSVPRPRKDFEKST